MTADGASGTQSRVTIRTVAEDAGVSVSAVSKVMRNAYGVSDALRTKVERSIDKLGYRPSVGARGMRGRTFTLGVLLVGIDNPFLPSVFSGIAGVAEAAGYKVMVGVGAAQARTEVSLIEQMIDNRMDGIILVAAQIAGKTLEKFANQIPIVVVGHHEPTAANFDTVNCDDLHGARISVQALLAKGYRDIAMISLESPGMPANVSPQRERGYLQAMADAGLSANARILHLPFDNATRDAMVHNLLASRDRPRAIFCWSDLDAVPVLNIASQQGIMVPAQLAVTGYDNSPVAALPLINLTSVDQDGARLGRMSAECLLSRIEGRKVVEHILIEPKLVVRGSI